MATACSDGSQESARSALDSEQVEDAAEAFCPVLWDYAKAVGETFNQAASDVAQVSAAAERRERWSQALDDTEALVVGVGEATSDWNGHPVVGSLAAEVERDVPLALVALDDIRALFVDDPDVDEQRHQARTQQVIVRMEKVIDLPKPDLAPNDPDGVLRSAFASVPACQHAVRDADDATARAND